MRRSSYRRNIRAFTLIELLVVVAIIGILAGLLLTAISSAKNRADIAVCKSHINAIQAALAQYEQDMGRYPRGPNPTAIPADLYRDDAGWLYAALMNRNTPTLGGGPNAPYLDGWKPEAIGVLPPSMLLPNSMGQDGAAGSGAVLLDPADYAKVSLPSFQNLYAPAAATNKLVLLDPWGNPYHYREWASIRVSTKDAELSKASPGRSVTITPAPPAVQKGMPAIPTAQDFPHNLEGFDIWSSGPNGINEFGDPESDDITNWSS